MQGQLTNCSPDSALSKLWQWFEVNGWNGYDPYDLKGLSIYQKLYKLQGVGGQKIRQFIDSQELHRPLLWRRLLMLPKKVNANTVALIARSSLKFAGDKDPDYLSKAKTCLDWLKKNNSSNTGMGWGYPFRWYSGSKADLIIEPNSPLVVVTSEAAHAFLDYFEITGDTESLQNAAKCIEFFLSLPKQYLSNGLCFAYCHKGNYVINANTNICGLMLRYNHLANTNANQELIANALAFTLSQQRKDGGWFYWASPKKDGFSTDSQHTGMVIQWLNICHRYNPSIIEKSVIKNALEHYTKTYFTNEGRPLLYKGKEFPIDIHSPAQAMITLAPHPEYHDLLKQVMNYTLTNMRNKDGSFIYRIYENHKVTLPYTRWAQAWMLWALSSINPIFKKDLCAV